MGVKKLLTFLNNYKNLITEKNLSDYKGYTIAIDISLLIYKLVESLLELKKIKKNKKIYKL